MLRIFRKTVGPYLQENIQIIWDGVSFEWAKEMYPQIYQVENSMRKLISKFMLIKLGIGWHKSSVPKDVQESIKSENYKPTHEILYEVDFIQLSNFLFKPYSFKDATKLPQVISDILQDGELTEEKKELIRNYIPKNNWDRYFSDLVDFESDEFKKKWQRLYGIRCKVAHNKSMTIDDYSEAQKLCSELTEVIEKAMSRLGSIDIPDDDKESISLHTIATVNDPTRTYVDNYLSFRDNLSNLVLNNSEKFPFINDPSRPVASFIDSSTAGQVVLPDTLHNNFLTIENTKNSLLSGETSISGSDLISTEELFKNTANDLLTSFNVDPGNLAIQSTLFTSGASFHTDADNDNEEKDE